MITGLHCRIEQGDDADADEPADDMKNPQPACVFRSFAGPNPAYKPGPAKIQISARIHGEWVEGPVLPIVIAAADVTPKGGAGKNSTRTTGSTPAAARANYTSTTRA